VKPASYGYPQQPPVPRSGKPKRNPVFGIVSFIVVLAATIGGSVLMYRIGDLMRPFMSAYVQTESMDVFQTVQPALEANSVGVMGVSLIGTIAWALCIAATVRNSARPAAIFGIVIGALAPFIIVAAGVMGAIG
jgi:membrane protein YqaA with SNARE-associated domain